MGHRVFIYKLSDQEETTVPFGAVVNTKDGWFFTVHACTPRQRGEKRCGYCGNPIGHHEAYVRMWTLRSEDTHTPEHEYRCMECIEKNLLHSFRLERLAVGERIGGRVFTEKDSRKPRTVLGGL